MDSHDCPKFSRYTVEDVSEDDEEVTMASSGGITHTRKKYTADAQQLLVLPKDDTIAAKRTPFPVGQVVLALFPNTTCLYKAVVVASPSKKKKIVDYHVQFDNDTADGVIPVRIAPVRFVLPYTEISVNNKL